MSSGSPVAARPRNALDPAPRRFSGVAAAAAALRDLFAG